MTDREPRVGLCEQADANRVLGYTRASGYHQFLKRQKHRNERRRARLKPDCLHGYGRYRGWET